MSSAADARPLLLLVDDDPAITATLTWALEADFKVLSATHRSAALALLRSHTHTVDAALVDLGLPPHPQVPDEGLALVREMLAAAPWLKIVVLSGQDATHSARHARALGAWEFLAKPAAPPQLREALWRAAQLTRRERDARHAATGALLGHSQAMQLLRAQIGALASTPFPLLIEGESGSGKELVAQALHAASPRHAQPFVVLNCAAIAPGLIESTLFGHARGAFTGATAPRAGFFEEAASGTLFLDEIGELPLDLQPRLLRVLESGDYQRVGETQTRHNQARVLAATNRKLRDEVRQGRFRADLFHRLGVLSLSLPPLRSLGEDRLVLLQHFCQELAQRSQLEAFTLSIEARALWLAYDFPGNVRELRNIVLRLLAHHSGREVDAATLSAEFDSPEGSTEAETKATTAALLGEGFSLDKLLRQTERQYIAAALKASRGSVAAAARLLGISRTTLYGRMGALGLRGNDNEAREDGP